MGAGRLPKLARLVTKAAVILPFEQELLRSHGVDATFVGHPLLDRARVLPTRIEARRVLGLEPNDLVLAVFPGSRQQEIARHLGAFVAVARRLEARFAGLRVLVSLAPGIDLGAMQCPYRTVTDESLTVLRAADAALCKSGTTTLEAAVAGCPLVIGYRTSAWTHAIARQLVRIPHIGLVNVVAGRAVAREFVQDDLEPGAVADALVPLLNGSSRERAQMISDLAMVCSRLGEPGAAGRVAALISSVCS